MSVRRCRIFLKCPSFPLCLRIGLCPFCPPWGRNHDLRLEGVEQTLISCACVCNPVDALESVRGTVSRSGRCISCHMRGSWVGISHFRHIVLLLLWCCVVVDFEVSCWWSKILPLACSGKIKEKLRNSNAIVTRADKGNSIVTTYRDNYEKKVNDFIHKNGAEESKNSITTKFQKAIRHTLHECKTLINTEDKWKFTCLNPKPRV